LIVRKEFDDDGALRLREDGGDGLAQARIDAVRAVAAAAVRTRLRHSVVTDEPPWFQTAKLG
jgi:hypothetical protein